MLATGLSGTVFAQESPPMLVVTSDAKSGMIADKTEFVGTVYYRVVSEVAGEVRGKVDAVMFDEAGRVKKGEALVALDAELLKKSIQSTRASYEEALAGLEKATLDYGRIEALHRQGLVSEQAYDDGRLKRAGAEKKAASLKAVLEGSEAELGKKTIRAPFDGVVLKRNVEKGEWLDEGAPVATVAYIDEVDVVVNVPEEVMRAVKTGMEVEVRAAGREFMGRVVAVVPGGDVKTRTFPVKIRIRNDGSFAGGMDARVSLPRGGKVGAVVVPRDALVSKFGSTVVFVAEGGKARMVPVQVVGYSGSIAGVRGDGIKEGMKVVVKGNERLNDGQPVNIMGGKK